MSPDHLIAAWAERHHGLITREVAHRCGLSDGQIRHRVRSGRWQRVRHGVWAPAGLAPTPLMFTAAAAWSIPATPSHSSASWLLDLLDDPPPRPELTAGRGMTQRADGVLLHRTADLARSDTITVQGIRCTNAIRTCIDMGARLDADELEQLIERALLRRLVHLTPLIARFLQLARRGRDGTATTRKVLTRMDPALEPAESDLETLFLQVLRQHGLPVPIRQHRVLIADRVFRIDLAYPDEKLAIESDGFAHHGSRSSFEHDRERQNLLVLDGWTVLRFTWGQICTQPDVVAAQVASALDRAAA